MTAKNRRYARSNERTANTNTDFITKHETAITIIAVVSCIACLIAWFWAWGVSL